MNKELSKEEHKDMSMTPILSKYQYQKPKDFGDYMERCYPVSAVMDMLKEYSDQNTKPLIDEIAKLKALKSENNEAVEFAEWIENNNYWYSKDNKIYKNYNDKNCNKTTAELYEIFKPLKNPSRDDKNRSTR